MSGKKLLIIGGGAAGFFCAVNAARLNPALRVEIVEKTGKLLSKVRVSGGGRCNITHACFEIDEMSKRYPRGKNFVRKAFYQFFTSDTIRWFEERGVKLKTEADGRMFPVSDSSQSVIDCLLNEAKMYGVEVRMNTEVKQLDTTAGVFKATCSNGEAITADAVCVACGGYPKSSLFDWLRKLGHSIEEPVPSLFTFNMPGHPVTRLMGVSVDKVKVRVMGTKLQEEGPLLITHWGLSGPAVLRLSAWGSRELAERDYRFSILINWLPAFTEQELTEEFKVLRYNKASQLMGHKNPFGLPQRLWEFLLIASGADASQQRWADLPSREQNKLIKNLCACEWQVKGKTTFKEEFVTAGGVRLQEVDVNTMMSKKTASLYFAGEILDVDGITGGYNFQHAWTSAFIAAKAIALTSHQVPVGPAVILPSPMPRQ